MRIRTPQPHTVAGFSHAYSLNPSHKGKGDSYDLRVVERHGGVLILVIKERVIPGKNPDGCDAHCLNPNHKGKGDS